MGRVGLRGMGLVEVEAVVGEGIQGRKLSIVRRRRGTGVMECKSFPQSFFQT